MLKVSFTSSDSAFCSMSGEIAASVVMKTSIVAIFGWIMPEPLAMPPIWATLPPSSNSKAASLGTVSVVMMASSASAWFFPSPAASAGKPFSMGSSVICSPMTPVEATMTSDAATFAYCAASFAIPSAISMPFALQVLALPELQTTAWA